MDEKNMNTNEQNTQEFITEKETKTLKEMFKDFLKRYKEKDPSMTDQEWLEELFRAELPEMSEEDVKKDANEIVESISEYNSNMDSVNEAAKKGVSKEAWLAEKLQEASVGMAVQEFGRRLQGLDDVLFAKNAELADALSVSVDGEVSRVNMNPNLDGILAEHLTASTTMLGGAAQGKNIRVDVLQSHNENSVDVRAINLDTGKYQNYQLKFYKDAKSTIRAIEDGNYNNQQIIVPTEQLEEVQAHFKEKGSQKTITDHIDAWGVEGKRFTKEELKEIQKTAQNDGTVPSLDYSHFQTKDLAMAIGKNAGAMALQAAAVTTGLTIAGKAFSGEPIEPDEMVELAIKTGADTTVKTVTAGTLQVAIRKGIISFIPKATPAGVIANIACVGIENLKVLYKVSTGELSVTKGLDQMGRTTVSMVAGLWAMTKGAAIGASLVSWIPVVGVPLAVVGGFVGGMVGYFGGSKIGEAVYNAGRKVANAAKTVAKAAWNGIKSTARAIGNGIKAVGGAVASLFGF